MTILVISEPQDLHATRVIEALHAQGARDVVLLNFNEFPRRMFIDEQLPEAGDDSFALTLGDGRRVALDEVTAVWWRRPQSYGLPTQGMQWSARAFALGEIATAFQGMWQCSNALWVNNVIRDAAASHKPWQLHVAKQCGLRVPETLITNNPQRVREFWDLHGGEVIYKPFIQTFHSWRETRKLKPDELAQLESVRLAPVIFQRLVPGRADLRITVIGDTVMPAAVDLARVEYKLDVRLNQQAYEPHELPTDVRAKVLQFMRRVELEYGAIDMRLTPEGEYVFFEVNPAGQFLFVEQAAKLPVCETLARHLIRGRASAAAHPIRQVA